MISIKKDKNKYKLYYFGRLLFGTETAEQAVGFAENMEFIAKQSYRLGYKLGLNSRNKIE